MLETHQAFRDHTPAEMKYLIICAPEISHLAAAFKSEANRLNSRSRVLSHAWAKATEASTIILSSPSIQWLLGKGEETTGRPDN